MGMFDWVTCARLMPDGLDARDPKIGRDFQTKDTDCNLDRYTITEDGRLLHEFRAWGDEGVQMREVPFHGWLRFYTSTGDYNRRDPDKSDYKWWEYMAKFTNGHLDEILPLKVYLERHEENSSQ